MCGRKKCKVTLANKAQTKYTHACMYVLLYWYFPFLQHFLIQESTKGSFLLNSKTALCKENKEKKMFS